MIRTIFDQEDALVRYSYQIWYGGANGFIPSRLEASMASWRRWPEESLEQYTAFEYYVELGLLRDREAVIAAIRSMRSSTARAKADQVYDWYYRFSWKDRAQDYDRFYEILLRWEFRRRELRMSVLINELVMVTLEAMLRKMVNDPQSLSFNELRLWLDTYARLRSILVADES